jgi:hypothetical protein
MRRGAPATVVFTLLVLCPWLLRSQTPKPPSLEEQLRAQYEPATVLTIQKEGILGVAPSSNKACPAKYQGGKLNLPDVSCAAPLKSSSRPLTAGEKVYPSKIDVDVAKEKVSFRIVECDSCNKGIQSASFKSQIDFQFAKGYLETAGVSQIVDTISEVLAFQEVAEQPPESPGSAEQPGDQTSGALTNNDVVKMTKVKLGDGIIISKIKASPCNFDTSVDALVKLKEAGVSDPVIQAIHDAQEAANAAANGTPASESTTAANPAAGHYVRERNPAEYVDLMPDGRFTLRERGKDYVGSYDVSGDTLTLQLPGGKTVRAKMDGERIVDQHENWVRHGDPQAPTAAAAVPGQVSFSVRHRHSAFAQSLFNSQSSTEYYCSGSLSVAPDGTIAYDCAQTNDPVGRCEHVSFAPGSLKQAKIGLGGNLHLATKTQGNFDFYGSGDGMKRAQAAIAPFVQTAQK